MRIGKPESKDNLRFQDIKIGETFRPKECWTEEEKKKSLSRFGKFVTILVYMVELLIML